MSTLTHALRAALWTPRPADAEWPCEWLISIARAALSSSALLIVWFESTEPAIYAPRALWLLESYVAFGLLVLIATATFPRAPDRARQAILACDLSFAVALTLVTRGPASPFLAFLLFALLSAACRWGSRETLITTAVVVAAIGLETLLVGSATPLSIGVFRGDFDLGRPLASALYVVIVGVLLAALAENEQRRRKEVSTIASLLEQAANAKDMEGTLEAVLGAIRRAFAADRTLLALTQTSTGRGFFWEAPAATTGTADALVTSELDDKQRETYLFDVPGPIWHALRFRGGDWFDILAVDHAGNRLPTTAVTLPATLISAYGCHSALGIGVGFGTEWSGRLLLINPDVGSDRQGALRLAHRLAGQIGPAAHQGYVLGNLRARAANLERAHLARELHDGIVQSLIVAEIQVEVVRRRSLTDAPRLTEALAQIQTLLRTEIGNLRGLTHRLKTADAGAAHLPGLTDLVARFERETGIEARLMSDPGAALLSARSAHEISHILQEGLVNVRKHSGAHHVLVRAGAVNGRLRLSIEDDGHGFPFSGRLSHTELAARQQGPAVIMERVRELGGEITVDSKPGRGARIDVAVPLQP